METTFRIGLFGFRAPTLLCFDTHVSCKFNCCTKLCFNFFKGESPVVVNCDKTSSVVNKFVVNDVSFDSDDESQDEDFECSIVNQVELNDVEIEERHENDENEFDSDAEDWDEIDRSHVDDDEFRQQMTVTKLSDKRTSSARCSGHSRDP